MNIVPRWTAGFFAVFVVGFFWAGCGNDDRPPTQLNYVNVGDGDGDNDGEEVDLCADISCTAPETCVEGECVVHVDEGYGCSVPLELGVLSGSASRVVEVAAPQNQPNLQRVSCAAEDRSPEAVFSFQVDGPSRVTAQINAFEHTLVMEVRDSSCEDSAAALFCSGASGEGFYAEAGVTYYLIVEARNGTEVGDFELELTLEEMVCAPPLSWRCEGDDRLLCYGGHREDAYACAAGCNDGVCLGDSCDNPLEVRSSQQLSGELTAFESTINLANSPSCSTEGQSGPNTPGQEMVLLLPGLQQGQTVIVNTQESGTPAAIAITDTCSQTPVECVAADSTVGMLEWEVVESGDYYVIIDPLLNRAGIFDYQIEILD